MQIVVIAGYKFIALEELSTLQSALRGYCDQQGLKGTILLSEEGINIALAGSMSGIKACKAYLLSDPRFFDISFHETYATVCPFQSLKVKLKKEIITLKQPECKATAVRAPAIAPASLKQWLDEKREITLLDTRNDYEISLGTFVGAVNLHLNHFSDLPSAIDQLDRKKPVVMFCTGGIRCEKAALYMQKNNFSEVYQLDGGILGYFSKVGGAHYSGECFVFDERVSISPDNMASSPF